MRARQENRPVARKHDSKVQSGPMQESVSLPGKKLFKTGKKEDHQEASRQLNKKLTAASLLPARETSQATSYKWMEARQQSFFCQ